ncbi:MAG: hypothetical protein NTW73_03125 [Candidatus Parcubacteria bacterium]|nr:hypothetical protein [Candidatus Parcubacteria bacterium]
MGEILSMIIMVVIILIPIGGISCLIEYKATKKKKFLIVGLILTAIVVGIIVLTILSFIRSNGMMVYMPNPNP